METTADKNSIDVQNAERPAWDEDLNGLDHMPLGRRLHEMRIKIKRKKLFENSDGKDDMVVDQELLSVDPDDIDHLPLVLRLNSMLAETMAARNHSDSDASIDDQLTCLAPDVAYKDHDMEIMVQETLGSSVAKEVVPKRSEETWWIESKASSSSDSIVEIDSRIKFPNIQDRTRIGESCYDPIDVDGYVEQGGIMRPRDELEESVERLERLLGLGYPIQT